MIIFNIFDGKNYLTFEGETKISKPNFRAFALEDTTGQDLEFLYTIGDCFIVRFSGSTDVVEVKDKTELEKIIGEKNDTEDKSIDLLVFKDRPDLLKKINFDELKNRSEIEIYVPRSYRESHWLVKFHQLDEDNFNKKIEKLNKKYKAKVDEMRKNGLDKLTLKEKVLKYGWPLWLPLLLVAIALAIPVLLAISLYDFVLKMYKKQNQS